MTAITELLESASRGDPEAASELLPLVYAELRTLASQRLARESPGQTLQATALVSEAYLRLISSDSSQPWNGRGHFFAAAAEAMRRILIENARRKHRVRHGGGRRRVELRDVADISDSAEDLLALEQALCRLEQAEPQQADLVKLRYFAGLTIEDAAKTLGISTATAKRRWIVARAWLYSAITGELVNSENP